MLFNSVEFIIFFIIVTIAYYLLEHRFRWILLLAASCYFYLVFVPIYLLILVFTIVIDYVAGIKIEESSDTKRKNYLILSLIVNIGILVFFKYYNFLNDNLTQLLGLLDNRNPIPYLSILLPIGLSFHTFQAMSYTIEVYRGQQKAERHFGIYALYVMFYPQLVAGPIERPQNVLHQFKEKVNYNPVNIVNGIQLMIWGFFKKIVVADRMVVLVDKTYEDPTLYGGFTLFVGTLFFTIQIYCDFSGYSDIAIGSAKTLGIDLMKNFNRPYFAKSITEFWGRWHISLSTWFRDYLYIPLGGNRLGTLFTLRNVFIVFLISGLWHGANWTYIVWGAIHGILILMERIFNINKLNKINKPIVNLTRILFMFFIINFTWVFFRASDIGQAMYILNKIIFDFQIGLNSMSETVLLLTGKSTSIDYFITAMGMVLLLFLYEWKTNINSTHQYSSLPSKNYLLNAIIVFCVLAFGVTNNNSFIYFQF